MSNVLHVLCFRMGSCIILASCQDPTTLWVTTVVKGRSTKLCGSTVHHNSLSFFSAKAKVMKEHFFFFFYLQKNLIPIERYKSWNKRTECLIHCCNGWNLLLELSNYNLGLTLSSALFRFSATRMLAGDPLIFSIWLSWFEIFTRVFWCSTSFFVFFFFPWFCYEPGTNFSLLLQHVQGRKSRMFEETAAKISWFVDRQDYEALWRRQNLLRAFCLQFLNQALDTCRSRSGRSFGLWNHASYSPMAVWPSLSFLLDWQNSQSKLTIKNL